MKKLFLYVFLGLLLSSNAFAATVEDKIKKMQDLLKGNYKCQNIIDQKESERFLNNVQSLRELGKSELHKLNIEVKSDLKNISISRKTIF